MKSIDKSKSVSIICYGISVLIFLAVGVQGIFLDPGDEMGYCVLNFYLLMPFATLIISYILGIKKGYLFFLYPIFSGAFGILIPILIFGTFATISLFFAFFPSFIGLSAALVNRFIK